MRHVQFRSLPFCLGGHTHMTFILRGEGGVKKIPRICGCSVQGGVWQLDWVNLDLECSTILLGQ